ncbi:DUF6191 domain-containing protein [Nocardia sp. NPDC001965]
MGVVWAMTLPGLVCLLIALAFAEVTVNRITGGRLLPWTRRHGSRTVAATGFEQVNAMFQGSKHIEFEQRQHALMHRDEESDGAPPLLAFDSVANRITFTPIPRPDRDTAPE